MSNSFSDLAQTDLFFRDLYDSEERREPDAGIGPDLDVATEFLLETLAPRLAIRERNGVSFLQARSWRRDLKEYQIKALKILKKHLPPSFVEAVADEMISAITKFHGQRPFNTVVPVPCGHSKRNDCLSVRMAQAIADRLDARAVEALDAPLRKGSSHPARNAGWPEPRLVNPIKGKVLLVDDVATSGHHMSKSLIVLRNNGIDALGLAWIGAR